MTAAGFESAPPDDEPGEARERVALEVLELGQALLDALLEAATTPAPAGEDRGQAFPVEEVRAAAGEFFRALRLLLGAEVADGA